MKINLPKNFMKSCALLFIAVSTSFGLKAQLTGTKTIPLDYPSIAAFVTDLNTSGVGAGGVIVNIAAGHTETAPVGGIHMTATGTNANPIIIQKSGAGANPVITAYAGGTGTPGTASTDGIFSLNGSDYVTIDGIDLTDPNTTNPSTMEYGYGLFKASATDGCQHNTIRNCTINLSIANNASGSGPNVDGSKGIWLASSVRTTSTTALTVTSADGTNSFNNIQSNTILNTNIGVAVIGFAASSPFTFADMNNEIGGASAILGNTISNFGGAASASNPSVGIRTLAQYNFVISNNVLNNNTGSGSNHTSTLRGILIGNATSASGNANNNAITLVSGATTSLTEGISCNAGSTAASNTININNNTVLFGSSTLTSGNINGIVNGGTASIFNINGNTISSASVAPISGTGAFIFIDGGSPVTLNINNNNVHSIARSSAAAGNFRAIRIVSPTTATIDGNTIENLAFITPTSTGSIDGIYSLSSAATVTMSNNIIRNFATPLTGTLTGIRENSTTGVKTISNNSIYDFATTFGGAGGGTFYGIHCTVGSIYVTNNSVYGLNNTGGTGGVISGIFITGGTLSEISRNKIYNLTSTTTGGSMNGIHFSGNTSNIAFNNIISNLSLPNVSAANPLNGINVSGGTATNLYNNTVYLNASSTGTDFGSSAISASTSVNTTLSNNIFINESVASGTGLTVAYRRSSTTLTSFNAASNNNLFYAGTPSATNVILFDGTTAQQSLANYQTLVAPRDAQAITGESFTYSTPGSFFISLTGSSADFLKPVVGIASQIESGASVITTPINLSTDFSGATRATFVGYTGTGTAPDRGAYEFEGVNPAPVITLNTVTPATTSQCVAAARLVSLNIITASGTISGANLTYSVNGVAQTPIAMTNTAGSTWEATIPVPTPGNATITWGVSATNSISVVTNYIGTAYSDEPLTGVTASASATATTICAGSPTDLSATLTKLVTVQVGNGTASNSSSTAVGAFYGSYWGNGHAQILIRASELTALGISAGNITSLSLNVSALGSPTTLNNFTVKMAPTSANAITTFQAPVFTTVVTAANYTPVLGLNTHTFSTPFNWDGTSNVIVDYCFANGVTGSTSAINTMTTTAFGSFVNYNADGAGGSGACSSTTVSNTSSNRPNLIFSGNGAPAISAISWSDGVTAVGTTNPSTVNPTATTTYTATITAAGCSVAPSPTVEVTVNPLPTAPTATNSAQCGVQIPTASVTSTSGLPTPTFIWYDAAIGGTVMQNSTSTTYTTAVSTTTTFHVAEINTTTGCESARVAVTMNVSTPDAISATPSATSICLGESVTLVAANTNPTPFQSYTYSWLSTTNSGVESATTGASIIATPTQAGSYTYDLTGVDGGCSAIASTIVTVNLNPTSVVAMASDATICEGDMTNLMVTATTNSLLLPATVLSENFDSGLGAWTTEFNGTAPVGSAWLAQNAPFSYTTYFNNFATPQGGGFAMTNGDIGGSGLKTRTKLTSPSFSTLGMTSATLTFQNLYRKWNSGDSLVRLEISTDGGTNWSTLKDYLPLGSQGVTTDNAQVPANESIALTAPYLNQANVKIRYNFVTAWGYYWVVDNVIVSGIQEGTTTYDWTSTPAGFTSSVQNPMGVAPVATTTYNVEVTNSFGCSATASTTVTVNSPSTSTTSVTECDSYTWNGTTYTTSGSYNWTGVNAAGCDSVATLNLTINNSTASSVTVTACDTYTWAQNSTTYTTSGMYDVTIANAIGCDSVITLNLTINNSTAATVNVTNCGPYTWALNSTTYNASGVHTLTIPNALGCDSVITLNLTINSPSTSSTTVTECDMYTWNGIDYTTSGTYTWMGTNAAGCDSTATLVLTINNSSTSSTSVTECDMYTWNGVDYTTSGTYTWIGTNALGCDSTATLMLTINNSTTSTTTASDCEMYTWNGIDYTTSGTYTWMGTNAAGCDSTATLVLTINSITATATDNGNATASASAGTSYEWINCATNLPIAGATAQTFAPTANGSYAVIVTNAAGCSDTSNCVTISNVGIKELVDHSLNVYPNPTNGNVTIEFSAAVATVEVIDAQGKSLQTQSVSSGDTISLENFERGVYFLKIKSENGSAIQRVVKN